MATDRSQQRKFLNHNLKYPNRPWHARKTYQGVRFHLGYFATREEAEEVERNFDEDSRLYEI